MRYLSFDIECSDGGKGAICSFGYIIADEELNIVEKRDILVNPEYRFFLVGRRKRPDIQLSYAIEEFTQSPSFPNVYEEIKELLENPDHVVMGYAVSNDADFIRKDCVRYNLPCINFTYFDIQKILKILSEDPNQSSLEKACDKFGISMDMELHKSDNDALLTFKLFKKIAEEYGKEPYDLLNTYPNCKGSLKNYISRFSDETEHKKNIIKPNPKGKNNCIINGTINKMLFTRFCRYVYPTDPSSEEKPLRGKKVCISDRYERYHFKEMIHIVQLICDLGGRYTIMASEADLFLTFNDIEGNGRMKYLKEDTTIVSLESFLKFNGTSFETIEKMRPKDIVYLENDKYSIGRY
ncbi:MAG: hypothetical protein K6F14_08790 [Clostridiales bacterium]|nr:hypothetical protein [Clostridiales bacterium]